VARTGVPRASIHHYRRRGLLPPARRLAANRFVYGRDHVEAVELIRLLRERRGLSLDDIADVLPELMQGADEEAFQFDALRALEQVSSRSSRERLVDAAVRAFSTRSFADVGVGDIAELAGLGKGNVYRHFTSKDALFSAAAEAFVADVVARFACGGDRSDEEAAEELQRLLVPGAPLLLELITGAVRDEPGRRSVAGRLVEAIVAGVAPHLRPGGDVDARARHVLETSALGLVRSALP
jgi:AcrR family transcriptional regulator